jgi:transposase-like protein
MISTSGSDAVSVTTGAVMPKLPVTADIKGRLRASKEQRRVILAKFAQSGMSAAQFARRTGLKYSTFAGWLQRYRRVKRPARKPAIRLLEAVVAPAAPAAELLVVHLPGGARLEMSDANQIPLVAALVRALEKPC